MGGGAVDKSAPFYQQWVQLQDNAKHLRVDTSRIIKESAQDVQAGQSRRREPMGLYWNGGTEWPVDSPICVYGGFKVVGTVGVDEEQQDYLLHVPNVSRTYIVGKPWQHMPMTHAGGRMNHLPQGSACTIGKWIPLERMLPDSWRKQLVARTPGVRTACSNLDIPILFSLATRPAKGELSFRYGSDAEKASPGITHE